MDLAGSSYSKEICSKKDIFLEIEEIETNSYYSAEQLVEQSKINKLEKEGRITLRDGQDIRKENSLRNLFRKNILYMGRFIVEHPVEISTTTGGFALSIINEQQIAERISKIKKEDQSKISYIHISTIQIIIKSTFLKGIDSPITIAVIDNRIRNTEEKIIGILEGNLKNSIIKFNASLQFGIPLVTRNLSNSIGIEYKFHRQHLMQPGDCPFTVTYAVGYALSNSHHSVEYMAKDRIYLDDLFKETVRLKVIELKNKEGIESTRFKIKNIPRYIKDIEEEKEEKKEENKKIEELKEQVVTLGEAVIELHRKI